MAKRYQVVCLLTEAAKKALWHEKVNRDMPIGAIVSQAVFYWIAEGKKKYAAELKERGELAKMERIMAEAVELQNNMDELLKETESAKLRKQHNQFKKTTHNENQEELL